MSDLTYEQQCQVDEARVYVMEWHRWRMRETGGPSSAAMDPHQALLKREAHAGDAKPIGVIFASAEQTQRAITALGAASMEQKRALLHYHLHTTTATAIAQHLKCDRHRVPAILVDAHANFLRLRRQERR